MTKEEIIKLAKEKKFVSAELCNNPYKYSSHEDMRWLFWLVEIQKWLRENHNIHISISYGELSKKYMGDVNSVNTRFIDLECKYSTYEEVLEAGVVKALKLIP
jgi:hypothetical protein